MNSTTLVARQYRIQQWADEIRKCQSRPTGMSVKDWSNRHELSKVNYYYRLKEVHKACLDHVSYDDMPQSIIPIPAELIRGDS